MSVCENCVSAKLLISQPQSLVIGSVAAASTAYKIYIENTATNRISVYEETSDADGLLTVDLTDKPIMPDHDHNLWATLATGGYKDMKPITLDGDVVNCLNVRLDVVRDSTGEYVSEATQTLELDD